MMEYLVIILGLIGIGLMIWRREWMLYILAASLPFERIPSFDVSGVTVRVGNILFLMAFILGLIEIFKRKKLIWQKEDWLLPIYLVVGVVGLFGAIDVNRGIEVLLFTLYGFAVYYLVKNMFSSGKESGLVKVVVVVGAVVAGLGLLQFLADVAGLSASITGLLPRYQKAIMGFPRIQSVGLEPLYLANFLLIPLGLLVAAKLNGLRILSKSYDAIAMILILSVLILAVSRGAYLGAIGLLILCILVFWKKLKLKNIGGIGLNLIMALLIAFVFIWASGMMTSGKKHGGGKALVKFTGHAAESADYSSSDRITTAKNAIWAWRESPIFGIGMGQFGPYFDKKYANASNRQIVNNEPLEILAETGIVGFLLIIWFMVMIFWKVIKNWQNYSDNDRVVMGGLVAAMAGIIIQFMFFSTLYIVWIWFVLGWMGGLASLNLKMKDKNEK